MWENWYDTAVRYGLPSWGENEFERGLFTGLLLAAATLAVLLILLLILKLIFRRKSLSGIKLKRSGGDIFVARQAIQSAIFQLAENNPALEILKIALFRRRRAPALAVTVLFDPAGGTFDTVAAEFQQNVLAMLKSAFGVDTVKTVQIHLAKVPKHSHYQLPPAVNPPKELPDHETPAGL